MINNALLSQIKKKHSEIYLNTIPDYEKLSTGLLSLDYALGGGLPLGCIVELAALPGVGKSTTALFLCKTLQEQGFEVAYLDLERSVKNSRFKQLQLSTERFHYIIPRSGKEALTTAMDFASAGVKLIVVDSVPLLLSEDSEDNTIDKPSMAGVARLLSQVQSRLVPVLEDSSAICLFINQVRTSIGSYHSGVSSSGGLALQYMNTLSIFASKGKIFPDGSGKEIEYTIKKNKAGKEGLKAQAYLLYESGICPYSSALQFFEEIGFVIRKGSWLYLTDTLAASLSIDPKLGQGSKATTDFFRSHSDVYSSLYSQALSSLR